ncbi:MAG TPA: hypothetical protein VFE08_01550, partial [Candidatus Sulfotelmatobacter sp.]|nr:hypothetical protein [Candidatus Sulfotelmatobacter sp.]
GLAEDHQGELRPSDGLSLSLDALGTTAPVKLTRLNLWPPLSALSMPRLTVAFTGRSFDPLREAGGDDFRDERNSTRIKSGRKPNNRFIPKRTRDNPRGPGRQRH